MSRKLRQLELIDEFYTNTPAYRAAMAALGAQATRCPNCGRDWVPLTTHHLVPQVKGGKDDPANLLELCRDCHEQLHVLYNPNHLRDHLNTRETLLADEGMRKFGLFANKQKKLRVKKRESKTKWRC